MISIEVRGLSLSVLSSCGVIHILCLLLDTYILEILESCLGLVCSVLDSVFEHLKGIDEDLQDMMFGC